MRSDLCRLLTCFALAAALGLSAGTSHAANPLRTLPETVAPRTTTSDADYRRFEGALSPLESNLFADAADARWDDFMLVGAALVASGVHDPATLDRLQAVVAGWVAELRQAGLAERPPRDRAEAVFDFMHRRVLRQYRLESTDLAATIESGQFNCVTASLLFNALAGEFDLTARGLEIPGHAMCRVFTAEGPIDVEATCPAWFRLMDQPEKQAELLAKAVRPDGSAADVSLARAREVSPVELVATIYYNRGVDLLLARDYVAALSANAKALRLDPANATARGNLLATLNNWAVSLAGEGRYAEAADALGEGLRIDPHYAALATNYAYVHRQWAGAISQPGRDNAGSDKPSP